MTWTTTKTQVLAGLALVALLEACSAGAPNRAQALDDLCSHLRDAVDTNDVAALSSDLRADAETFDSIGDPDTARTLAAAADQIRTRTREVTLSLEQDADIQAVRAELVAFDEIFDADLVEGDPPSIVLQVRSNDIDGFAEEMMSIAGVAAAEAGDPEPLLSGGLAELAASCDPPVTTEP